MPFLALCLCQHSASQEYRFDLEYINIEHGLPARQVFDFTQDQEGFIWVSTRKGIHRFDGHSFKTYSCKFLGLPDRNPVQILVDVDNRLWYQKGKVLTKDKISGVLDLNTGALITELNFGDTTIALKDLYSVSEIEGKPKAILLMAKNGRMYEYDGQLDLLYHFKDVAFRQIEVRSFGDNYYLISTGKDLFWIRSGKIERRLTLDIESIVDRVFFTDSTIVVSEIGNGKKRTYLALQGEQLIPAQIHGESTKYYDRVLQIHPEYTVYARKDQIMVRDTVGRLLYSTKIPNTLRFFRETFLDNQNNLWLASTDGVYKLGRRENHFEILNAGVATRAMLKVGSQFWFSGNMEYMIQDLETGVQLRNPFNTVPLCFLQDRDGQLLVGTVNGLFQYVPDSILPNASDKTILENTAGHWKTIASHRRILLLFQNPVTNNYWMMGTKPRTKIGEGVIIDLQTGQVQRSLLPDAYQTGSIRTFQFLEDTDGIWVGEQ